MYGSVAWSSSLQRDVNLLERGQRKFSKSIPELHNLTYEQRLERHDALSLVNRRLFADLVFSYKVFIGLINRPSIDFGLEPATSSTRSNGVSFQQRPISKASAVLFPFRVALVWNKLSSKLKTSTTLSFFEHTSRQHLLNTQHVDDCNRSL